MFMMPLLFIFTHYCNLITVTNLQSGINTY